MADAPAPVPPPASAAGAATAAAATAATATAAAASMPASPARSGDDSPTGPGPLTVAAPAGARTTAALGVGMMLLSVLLAYLLLALWPVGVQVSDSGSKLMPIQLFWNRINISPSLDVLIIMLVMVTGALGSFVHAATSFGDFVGNEKLSRNWIWWYLLRPFVGMAIAAIFYLVIRGGLLSGAAEPSKLNLYGIVAMAGLVGMFSKQAIDKLGELFDTLFRTNVGGGDSARKDGLKPTPHPAPGSQDAPTGSAVSPPQPVLSQASPDDDLDCCSIGGDAVTADEDLPETYGGVA